MPICDSHCHVSTAWFAPVESLLHEMDSNGVEKAVLVQIRGQFDSSYQIECRRRYPDRFASVVLVDTDRPDAPERLADWAERGAVGLRLRPETRSPGDDPLAIWRAAERLGLAVSCAGTAASFAAPAFADLIRALAATPIVLEHHAGLERLDGSARAPEAPAGTPYPTEDAAAARDRARVLGLARFPNVYAKVHGLGEFCLRALPVTEPFPFVRPIPPLLPDLIAAFGPERLMWASDFPPVSTREGYALALRLVAAELADRAEHEREQILGGTALRVFPVRPG